MPSSCSTRIIGQRLAGRSKGILTSPSSGWTRRADEETEALIRTHANLVARRTWGQLTPAEKKQLARLESDLADRLTAPGESVKERELQTEMSRYVARRSRRSGVSRDPVPSSECG